MLVKFDPKNNELGAGNATPVYGCEGQSSTHVHYRPL